MVAIPKGVAHAFRNIGSEPARLQFHLCPPGSSEPFFHRLAFETDEIGDFMAFFAEHGIDLLGSPID